MIIYTPFIGGGLEDERLVNLAETWARAGFVVAVPWRESDTLIVSTKDIEDLVVTIEYVAENFNVKQVGLFGISYGAGPTFAAAADSRVRDVVPFVISLNGYGDLNEVIRFISTGEYSYGEIAGTLTPHSYPGEILEATLQAGIRLNRLGDALSPIEQLEQVDADIYIVHSTADIFIPYTESMRLHDAARREGLKSKLLLTEFVEHGTYRPLSPVTIWRYYLPAVSGLYSIVSSLVTY
jgi:dipeptidyl aminopeptidase/acylaminoacyl peptidase